MEPTPSANIEELLQQKKNALAKMDENLLQQLAKQKLLQELLNDLGSSSLASYSSRDQSSDNSMMSSNCSGISYDTQYVAEQIEKVKAFMNEFSATGQFPELPERIDPHDFLLQKKMRLKRQAEDTRLQKQEKQKDKIRHIKEMIRFDDRQAEHSFELSQLNEAELFLQKENLKTAANIHKRQQQLQQTVMLKQTMREQSLRRQRQLIRKQLLEEQRTHQQNLLPEPSGPTLPKRNNCLTLWPQAAQSTLKAERDIKFRGILKACSRASRKAHALGDRIRNFSYCG